MKVKMKCYFLYVQASLLPGASSRDMAITCSAQEHMFVMGKTGKTPNSHQYGDG